jgi:transposase
VSYAYFLTSRKLAAPQERGHIQGLREAGLNYRDIAARVGRSIAVVSQALNPKPAGTCKPRGRPPKSSERDVRRIVRRASEGERSAGQIVFGVAHA